MSDVTPKPKPPIFLGTVLDGDNLAAANGVAAHYELPQSDVACTFSEFTALGIPMPVSKYCAFVEALVAVLEVDKSTEVRP